MKLLILGAGGVGSAAAKIAARRDFLEQVVVADYDADRAAESAAATGDSRFSSAQVDAGDQAAVEALLTSSGVDAVLGATDPRFTMPIFQAALNCGVTYLDMAMSLSVPHASAPHSETGVKLGDEQFALAEQWESAGALALVGIGVEPGLSDVFARYASDHLFSEIDELGTRDGANLEVLGDDGEPIFAPTFSIWTTIEECLNPPVIYEEGRGWFTTPPFSEPETFDFPEGIGPVECVNVEHEEVLLMPRWLKAKRVTFKYGLGDEFIGVLKTLHLLGLDSTTPLQVGGRAGQPAGCGRGRAAEPGHAGRPDAGQDLRRAVGPRDWARTASRVRPTSTTWSTTNGRCANTDRRRWCGRPRSTRSWRWN